jgi:hypothetical protein
MLESAAGLCRDSQTPAVRATGAIVFSASCRLLFIDRSAIDLLGTVELNWRAPTSAQLAPRCLMTIVQEIVTAQSAMDSGPPPSLAGARHLLGERSQPIRAQTFLLPSQQHEGRIVFVLSP